MWVLPEPPLPESSWDLYGQTAHWQTVKSQEEALEQAHARALPGPKSAKDPGNGVEEEHRRELLRRETELRRDFLDQMDATEPVWDLACYKSGCHRDWIIGRREYVGGDDAALGRMLAAVTHDDPPLAVITPPQRRQRGSAMVQPLIIVLLGVATALLLCTVIGWVHWA